VARGVFHDGSETGTASVHQILCQPWESATETLKMINKASGTKA